MGRREGVPPPARRGAVAEDAAGVKGADRNGGERVGGGVELVGEVAPRA